MIEMLLQTELERAGIKLHDEEITEIAYKIEAEMKRFSESDSETAIATLLLQGGYADRFLKVEVGMARQYGDLCAVSIFAQELNVDQWLDSKLDLDADPRQTFSGIELRTLKGGKYGTD